MFGLLVTRVYLDPISTFIPRAPSGHRVHIVPTPHRLSTDYIQYRGTVYQPYYQLFTFLRTAAVMGAGSDASGWAWGCGRLAAASSFPSTSSGKDIVGRSLRLWLLLHGHWPHTQQNKSFPAGLPPVRIELTLLSEPGLKPGADTDYATAA